MALQQPCAKCWQTNSQTTTYNEQPDFYSLQIRSTECGDQKLVDTRMLGVQSSAESRKTTNSSNNMSTERHSDYWLKRFMASSDKIGTFLRRLPHAKTHTDMEALAPSAKLQRSDTN